MAEADAEVEVTVRDDATDERDDAAPVVEAAEDLIKTGQLSPRG